MITEQEIKTLFLEAKDCEVKAESNQFYESVPEKTQFFRGKKEAYAYIARQIELLMKRRGISL